MTDLEMIKATYGEEDIDQKLDTLFDHIGDLLFYRDPVWGPLRGTAPCEDGFVRVNEILGQVDVTKLSTTLMIGYLSITRQARLEEHQLLRLSNGPDFVARVEAELNKRCPEKTRALLAGLR